MVTDQPFVEPNNPEVPTQSGEITVEKPVESVATPEVLVDAAQSQPADVPTDPVQVPTVLDPVAAPVADDEIEEKEAAPVALDDTAVISGDAQYITAVKKIIHDDSAKPYLEEEDSEDLQKGYLKERFGVSVDMEEEEK